MKTDVIRLRVSEEVKEAVRIMADKQDRTISNYILHLIADDIRLRNKIYEDKISEIDF